jgi:hypothetical protein
MSELLEPCGKPADHKPTKCPFCPIKKNEEHYTTYGGADNDGGKLGEHVNHPKKFGTSTEADARPKDGATGKDGRQNQSFADTEDEKLCEVQDGYTSWKFQAHHAISGNQCLKGHDIEKFIVGGEKVKYDTGYSVNNPQNGIWLPSFPADGNWPADPGKKYDLARKAMATFKRQFHLGHHNIALDSDNMDLETDAVYMDYVKSKLDDLHFTISTWEMYCPEKEEDGKHLGNPRIHAALDHIASHIIGKLKGTPRNWSTFVSRHARDFAIRTRNPKAKLDFEK